MNKLLLSIALLFSVIAHSQQEVCVKIYHVDSVIKHRGNCYVLHATNTLSKSDVIVFPYRVRGLCGRMQLVNELFGMIYSNDNVTFVKK